jgi:hypothetical protein
VAHYGRGRGEYTQSEYPEFWQDAVKDCVLARVSQINQLCERPKPDTDPKDLVPDFKDLLTTCAKELLRRFYPKANV